MLVASALAPHCPRRADFVGLLTTPKLCHSGLGNDVLSENNRIQASRVFRKQMSVMDLHKVCLWCLGSRDGSKSCDKSALMYMKAIRVREAKFYVAIHKR